MVNPATILIVAVVTGIGGAVTYTTFHYAHKISSNQQGSATVNDLMPMPLEEGPPLPRGLNIHWPWRR